MMTTRPILYNLFENHLCLQNISRKNIEGKVFAEYDSKV